MEQAIQTRKLHLLLWAAGALGAAVAAVVFYFLDPAQTHVFVICYFHSLTGLDCPGCGGQRALHQLLHGNLAQAFHLNALIFLLLPLTAWFALREIVRVATGKTWPAIFNRPRWIWFLVGTVVVFGLVRNLPFFPFTALRP